MFPCRKHSYPLASYAMSRALGLLFVVLFPTLPCVASDEEANEVVEIRPSQLRSMRSSARVPLVLDVRTPYEYDAGHITGAVNIPHVQLEDRLSEVRSGVHHGVVLYCMGGPRARVGENLLQEQQIGPLYHLEGGYLAWKKAGYAIEKTERPKDDNAKQ